jgi:hypothetical protein
VLNARQHVLNASADDLLKSILFARAFFDNLFDQLGNLKGSGLRESQE